MEINLTADDHSVQKIFDMLNKNFLHIYVEKEIKNTCFIRKDNVNKYEKSNIEASCSKI